jgi:hypothetical protein
MTDLLEAFAKLRDDDALLQRFTEDPEGVLNGLGVDTSDVTVARLPGGNAPLENFKQALERMETEESTTVCVSAGAAVCVSVGSSRGTDPR